MQRDLIDLYRIMRKDGRMFLDFRTEEDCLYGKGAEVDEHSFKLNKRAGGYASMLYTLLSRDQVEELLVAAGFTVEGVERVEL
jgi:hypothetical protein